MIRIALIGNPNCGKTTLFNVLAGTHQQVGNWPGVTVERKLGHFKAQKHEFEIIDLPGIYTLAIPIGASSQDELLANEFIQSQQYDVIVNVVDAVNLERNLYLTTQLLELGRPMILALNRLDLAHKQGIKIDIEALSASLNCPVVAMVARDKVGLESLKNTLIKPIAPSKAQIDFPEKIKALIHAIKQRIPQASLFQCINWLEGSQAPDNIKTCLEQAANIDIEVASNRYHWIEKVAQKSKKVICGLQKKKKYPIDKVLCHRYLGFPIFLGVMYALFFFAINIGGVFQDFFELSTQALFVDSFGDFLNSMQAPQWLYTLMIFGLGQGISTVLTFVPIIGAMYFALAFLEDSGYLARAAFVMDRLMQAIGLPGKAFVPMIIGFGCNVPAIMGMRTLENKRDRILAVMMSPFMSCGARLAIFTVFASAFYPQGGANIIFLLYLVGILMAVLTGLLLKSTLLKGVNAPFLLEMPRLQMPHWTSLWMHAWHRLKRFVLNAGKLILPVCVLIGVLNHYSVDGQWLEKTNERSVLSQAGKTMVPIFAPIGMEQNNWPAAVGLLSGVLAKEVVVGTLNSLYAQQSGITSAEDISLKSKLIAAFSTITSNLSDLTRAWRNPITSNAPVESLSAHAYGEMVSRFNGQASAFAYLLFVLLYFPCVSATAAMVREVHRGWTLFSLCWTTGIAYLAALVFYQTATFMVHPWASSAWIATAFMLVILTIIGLKHFSRRLFPKTLPTPITLRTV